MLVCAAAGNRGNPCIAAVKRQWNASAAFAIARSRVSPMTCRNHAGVAGSARRGDNDHSRLSVSQSTETKMDKFLVLYRAPNSVIDGWMKKPEQERKSEETRMMEAWEKWMSANASKLTDKGAGAGKPKVVSSSGVKDARNDIMMYQIVRANSADEAAKMFVDHPHLGIPQATIEVMPLKAMEG
jgi:hypothetical protein